MTKKSLKNEQIHSRKKSFVPEEIRRDFPSRVTVDHCLRALERRRISDGKSPRKSSVIFPLVWQDHNAAFTRSNCWTNRSVQPVGPTVGSTVASCERSSNRLVQPVGRIKHVKFIQPVEPTVASLKHSFTNLDQLC